MATSSQAMSVTTGQPTPTTSGQSAPTAPAGGPNQPQSLPYAPQRGLAAVLLAVAVVIMIGTGLWLMAYKATPGYTGGGAAAAVAILLVLALILEAPSLIMDDAPAVGGEPSTMRILSLAIVLTFCILMLRTGWNTGELPNLKDQSNWIWLVTAALGGKALQKFAEVQDKK